jgi:hypothetical protein
MIVKVRPEAEIDILEAATWYENERAGLGGRFLSGVRETLRRVELTPRGYAIIFKDVRRALVDRFPFGVFFFVEGETATVIAVMHLHRRPASWSERR